MLTKMLTIFKMLENTYIFKCLHGFESLPLRQSCNPLFARDCSFFFCFQWVFTAAIILSIPPYKKKALLFP